MNGNGELTETENVIFLRKLRSSYGILTDKPNSYVLCYGNSYGNGYGTLETWRHTANISPMITPASAPARWYREHGMHEVIGVEYFRRDAPQL